MANFFSKKRLEKRQLKMYKMGRVKSSIIYALLFAMIMIISDPIWDLVFSDPIIFSNYFNWGVLFKFIFNFVIWYVVSYYFLWNEYKSTYKKYHKEKV